MIFEELTLKDFRQFAGAQTIKFSTDKRQNVTVIHGFNGAGKTTLLNAFTWLLYGEFSPDFEGTDRLENEGSFSSLRPGESLETQVKVLFKDGDRRFTVQRTMTVTKDAHGTRQVVDAGKLSLIFIDENGETQEPNNPQDTLERMLPKRLYPFFFFNGERIDRLARADAYEEIGHGIRTLLDIELFDRAIGHLDGEMTRRLQQDITRHAGQEGQRAQQELDALTTRKTTIEESIKQHGRNRAALEDERDKIDAKLGAMPDLAKWQAQRKAAEDDEKRLMNELKDRKHELARLFSRSGYLLMVPDILRDAKGVLEAARKKGEIPGPIKRLFIQDLLASKKCICERDLLPGTNEYKTVEDWRNRTFSDELESVISVTKGRLDLYDQRAEDCQTEMNRLQAVRDDLSTQLKRRREELSELSGKIGDREHGEDPAKLERRRRDVDEQLSKIRMDAAIAQRELQQVDEQIQEKQREIRSLEKADAEGQLAQRRFDAVANVVSALHQIRDIRYEELKEDLSERLGEVWGGIAIKDYRARLDGDFRLKLTKDVAGQEEPVRGASTGEKQVLSLAFVGALSSKARATAEQAGAGRGLFRGGLYPLVIDSAFGSLEVEYRRDVAKWVPSLAPQIILMVSESQFRQEVQQELLTRIGAEWVLKCETPKNTSREIALHGRAYPYVVQSSDGFERTTFVEVTL